MNFVLQLSKKKKIILLNKTKVFQSGSPVLIRLAEVMKGVQVTPLLKERLLSKDAGQEAIAWS